MTKELLEKLKNAKFNEEFKLINKDNKVELTDADLEQISGGDFNPIVGVTSPIPAPPPSSN